MQDRPTLSPDPAADDAAVERDILALLTNSGGAQLWSAEELQRELGGQLVVTDALARLQQSGLVHRLGEFVFITRAARRSLTLADS